jgi:RNA recognition motif-containing protein
MVARGVQNAVTASSEGKGRSARSRKQSSRDALEVCSTAKAKSPAASPAEVQEHLNSTKASSEIVEQTTIFLRNVPLECTRESLLQVLDDEGFSGAYDFVYLPIDFQTKTGLGYAIINMVSHGAAVSAQEQLTGYSKWRPYACRKALEVSWNGPLQGLPAHIERYRNSPLMHESIPDYYRPALFQNRVRVDFPAPTAKIKAPRIRHPKADGKKK